MEHLYAKQVGCGNADTTKWEFMTNIHRDSFEVECCLYYYN